MDDDSKRAGGNGAGPIHLVNGSAAGRIRRNHLGYARILLRAIRNHVSPSQILRTQYPFLLPDSVSPAMLSVEFTNRCNLQCIYCDSHLKARAAGDMSPATFSKLIESVRELDGMVKVVGNGECTLHPEFPSMVRELADASKHLYVLTNGNWDDPSLAEDLLHADVVGLSIDAGSEAEYERSRRGGNFNRLLRNIQALGDRRQRRKRSAMVIIRLMIRPSQREREAELVAQWRPYVSAVFKQYVYKMPRATEQEDVFTQTHQATHDFPRCGAPFSNLDVNWDGNVPLCSGSVRQVGPPGHILGNVNEQSLKSLWASPVMKQYRDGFRAGDPAKTPICEGCATH